MRLGCQRRYGMLLGGPVVTKAHIGLLGHGLVRDFRDDLLTTSCPSRSSLTSLTAWVSRGRLRSDTAKTYSFVSFTRSFRLIQGIVTYGSR
jgi:hypothetical protein